jgi:hypothetical protein
MGSAVRGDGVQRDGVVRTEGASAVLGREVGGWEQRPGPVLGAVDVEALQPGRRPVPLGSPPQTSTDTDLRRRS